MSDKEEHIKLLDELSNLVFSNTKIKKEIEKTDIQRSLLEHRCNTIERLIDQTKEKIDSIFEGSEDE